MYKILRHPKWQTITAVARATFRNEKTSIKRILKSCVHHEYTYVYPRCGCGVRELC